MGILYGRGNDERKEENEGMGVVVVVVVVVRNMYIVDEASGEEREEE